MTPRMESFSPTKWRLNLFAFPSETDSFFILFMVAAILLATQLSRVFLNLFTPQIIARYQNLDLVAMVRGELLANTLTAVLPLLCVPAMLSAAIFGMALFINRRHPSRVRHRKKLQALSEKDAPVQQAVNELAVRFGISPAPTVEMPAGFRGGSGQAFGFRGSYFLGLDGGLRVWRRIKIKQGSFNAVVLHELAHIVNGDIWRSYFAEALWTAMIVMSIAPLVLGVCGIIARGVFTGLISGNVTGQLGVLFNALPEVFSLLFKTGMIVIVITAIRARLLRTREVYADWRAALWGAGDALKQMFQNKAEREKNPLGFGVWRLHPTATERLAALNQPGRLFRLSWALPLLVGILSAFVFGGTLLLAPPFYISVLEPIRVARIELGNMYQANPNLFIGVLFWVTRGAWFMLFFAGFVGFFAPIAWLISSVLGTQLQKQTAADLAEGRRGVVEYLKLGIPAMWLALGMEIGFLVVPFGPFAPDSLTEIVASFVFLIVIAILVWWFLAYARFISIRMLSTHTGATRPTWRMRLVAWALNGWLFFFFMPGLVLGLLINISITEVWVSILLWVFAAWMVSVMIFSPVAIGISWVMLRVSTAMHPPRCTMCGQVNRQAHPTVELCAHCGHHLGEWLFLP